MKIFTTLVGFAQPHQCNKKTAPILSMQKNHTNDTDAMCVTASALVRWKMHPSRITVYGFIIIIIYFVLQFIINTQKFNTFILVEDGQIL